MYHVNYVSQREPLLSLTLSLICFCSFDLMIFHEFSSKLSARLKKNFTKNNFFTVTYMYGNCKWNQKLMHQDSMFLMIGTRSIHNQIQFLYIQSPNSWLILGQFLNNTSLLLPHSSHCIITSLPLDFFISQSGNSSLSQSSFLCVLLQQYIYCLHLLF